MEKELFWEQNNDGYNLFIYMSKGEGGGGLDGSICTIYGSTGSWHHQSGPGNKNIDEPYPTMVEPWLSLIVNHGLNPLVHLYLISVWTAKVQYLLAHFLTWYLIMTRNRHFSGQPNFSLGK